MNQDEVFDTLEMVGAIIYDGHFVYASGRHGESYFNKDALYPHLEECDDLACEIADRVAGNAVQVTVGPAVGGALFARDVARFLNEPDHEVLSIYADKIFSTDHEAAVVVKRGYDTLMAGKRVLVVEDVLTTGATARKTVEAVRAADGVVVGVGVICNRGGITAQQLGVPELFTLLDIAFKSWDKENCPLCKAGVPVSTDIGRGREYLLG